MLDNLDFPLTTSQLLDFFVSGNYAPYFHLQQSIHELDEASFIRGEIRRNTTSYHITEEGQEALELFIHKIPVSIREDILEYFNKNIYKLRKETEIISDYCLLESGEYMATGMIKEKNNILLQLDLNVISESSAKAVCEKWQEKSGKIYDYIIRELLLDTDS